MIDSRGWLNQHIDKSKLESREGDRGSKCVLMEYRMQVDFKGLCCGQPGGVVGGLRVPVLCSCR